MSPVELVLERVKRAKRSGEGWTALCPAHEDRHPSLSITEGADETVLLTCHAGCTFDAIVAALGLEPRDLFARQAVHKGGGGPRKHRATGNTHAPGEGGTSIPPNDRAQVHTPSGGLTLERYAQAKRLPVEFLRAVGLSDFHYAGEPALRIPYMRADATEAAIRFRLRLEKTDAGDDRFRWKQGSKTVLYGLSRLERARELGYVVLVEGESDCQTLWHHDRPAVGLPGANQWNEARDAAELDGIDTVYVVLEPDQGGSTLLDRLKRSRIRDRLRLVRLETKDVSELHIADEAAFTERFELALQRAVPWAEHERIERDLQRATSWASCEPLATKPRILDMFLAELAAAGVVGERDAAAILYLSLVSRLSRKPVSVVVKGLSSAGKSFVVEGVLAFFPETAFYELTSMTDRALAYLEEPLAHRHLVIFEAAGMESEFASYLLRTLLSEGRIRYQIAEKTGQGMRGRLIEIEGPVGVLLTTTEVALHSENETRLLSLTVADTAEQTRLVLLALAEEDRQEPMLAPWVALQRWLEAGPRDVTIPYARDLAELVPPIAVRLRRDFGALLALVRAHALLHQARRQVDGRGRIVATLDDYAVVRGLVRTVIAEAVDATVLPTVRETVKAVAELCDGKDDEGVSVRAIAQRLDLDRSAASRRARNARLKGYLKNLEEKRGRPARYVIGIPLPAELELLPKPEALEGVHSCTANEGGTDTPLPPDDLEPVPEVDDEDVERWKRILEADAPADFGVPGEPELDC